MTEGTFRILALDGGGIRGAYEAAVLATLEEATGKRVIDHFDLITGTSTGGMIAVALGLGIPATKILDFYRERGAAIFPQPRWWQRPAQILRQLGGAKYDAAPLRQAVAQVFGDRLLGESSCRLVIPAYDVVSNDVHVFKTAHHERFRQDYKRRAVEVALATTAAPTYFARAVTQNGEQLVDGGVWANCPAVVAIAEALDLGVPLTSMKMLSIGTLGEARTFAQVARRGGMFHYALAVVSLLMDAQAHGAWAQARLLLKSRAHRIDHSVAPGLYSLDNASALDDLISHGRYDGRHAADLVAREFLQSARAPFVPMYSV